MSNAYNSLTIGLHIHFNKARTNCTDFIFTRQSAIDIKSRIIFYLHRISIDEFRYRQ